MQAILAQPDCSRPAAATLRDCVRATPERPRRYGASASQPRALRYAKLLRAYAITTIPHRGRARLSREPRRCTTQTRCNLAVFTPARARSVIGLTISEWSGPEVLRQFLTRRTTAGWSGSRS